MNDRDWMVEEILEDLKRGRQGQTSAEKTQQAPESPAQPVKQARAAHGVEAAKEPLPEDVPVTPSGKEPEKDELKELLQREEKPYVHKQVRKDPKAVPDNERSKAFIEAFLKRSSQPAAAPGGALGTEDEEPEEESTPGRSFQRTVPINVVKQEPLFPEEQEEPEEPPKKKRRFGRKKKEDTAVFSPPEEPEQPAEEQPEAQAAPAPQAEAEPAAAVQQPTEPEQAAPPPEDEAQLSFLEQKDEEEEAEQRRKKRIMDFILTPDVEDGEEDFNVDDAPDKQEEPEAIEITEFESYDQVDAIKNDMAATTAKLFVRILLLLIPSAVCLYSMLAGQFTLPFGNYFTPEEPAVYAFLNLAMLGFSCAVSLFTILSGLGSFFRLKANGDSMVSLAAMCTLVYNAYLFYQLDRVADGSLPVFSGVVVFALLFNTIGKFFMVRRIKRNFSFVAKKDEKFGCIKLSDKASELIAEHTGIEDVNAYAQYRTGFIKHFLGNSYATDYCDKISVKWTQVFFWLSVALAGYSFFMSRDIGAALATLAAATAITAPFTALLISNWPLARLSKVLRRWGAIITGYNVVEELEQVDVVVAEDRDVLPAGTVALHGFKPFGGHKPDDLIIYAASIMSYLNNSLSDVFSLVIQGNTKLLMSVESVNASDLGGVEAWVGGRRIHIGSREYMQSHDITVPSKDYENKYLKPGRVAFYMAVSSETAAMFVISYKPRDEIVRAVKKLAKSGVMLLVKTTDPNVNSFMLSELFDISREYVDVLPVMVGQMVDKECRSAESADSGFVHKGSIESLAYGLTSIIKLRWTLLLGAVLQTMGSLLGLGLVAFFTIVSTLAGITPLSMLLYQGMFLVVIMLLQRLRV